MDLATLANVLSATAVVSGVVFGMMQIRHMSKTRAIFSSAELVHAMQNAAFVDAVGLLLTLPENADPKLVTENPQMMDAAQLVGHVFESLGVLVYHRILPLHLVDDLMGGFLRDTWLRLRPFVEEQRREHGVYYSEWMQWLVERLEEHPSPGKKQGAHLAHRRWRP
ncbi:MAG: hypothetical protein FJ102_18270 [Deltaproteobacteria bacterium]|nr:hypothetical protein [Deltaproteobacteria bacterium]